MRPVAYALSKWVFTLATLVFGAIAIHRAWLWHTGQGQADFMIIAGLFSLAFAATTFFMWVRLEKPRD